MGEGEISLKSWVPTFVRVNRLGWPLNNGKGFSKISKSTERDGAYHLQFDFPLLFSAAERQELENEANGAGITPVPFRTEKKYFWT